MMKFIVSLFFKYFVNDYCHILLKGIAGVYYSRVTFAVKAALWLLELGTRDWTLFRVLAFGTFGSWVRIQKLLKNNYSFTIEKYSLWYKAITKLYLNRIYYTWLNGWILVFTISLLIVRWPPNYFLCFIITTYCLTHLKSFA